MTTRLWASTTPSGGAVAPGNETLGNEFEVSKQQSVYAIFHWSQSGAVLLPTAAAVWDIDNQQVIVENLSPSWSGAAGSGWVSITFDGSSLLNPGTHYAVGAYSAGASNWRYHTPSYWTSGPGAGGITSGALSAPGNAASQHGQSCANVGSFGPPLSSGGGQNFWVDVQVGDPALAVIGKIVQPNDTTGSAAYSAAANAGSAAQPGTGTGQFTYSHPSIPGEIT